VGQDAREALHRIPLSPQPWPGRKGNAEAPARVGTRPSAVVRVGSPPDHIGGEQVRPPLSWGRIGAERREVAAKADIAGPLENPQASTRQVLVTLIQNAFFKTILPGFERELGRAERRP
jgi:hypothetical protein